MAPFLSKLVVQDVDHPQAWPSLAVNEQGDSSSSWVGEEGEIGSLEGKLRHGNAAREFGEIIGTYSCVNLSE